jgi:hypothetical protein
MNRELAIVASRQYGVFTHEQAAAVGMTNKAIKGRLRAGTWEPVERGLYVVAGTPVTWRREVQAAVLAAGDRAVASCLAAAALWRVPGFGEGRIDVSTPHGCDHKFTLGRLRQSCLLLPQHVSTVDGIPVTTPARTLFDLAAEVNFKRLERAANNALAMRLVTEAALVHTLDTMAKRGRTGTRAFRRMLRSLGCTVGNPESGLELDLLGMVADAGLPMPELQVEFGDDQGFIARVDALWRPQRVIGEADSDRFHTAPLDVEADRRRDERLTALGFEVVRFDEAQIRGRSTSVIARLRAALSPAA